jgi:zinc finger HIT domain-containing protein 1
MELFGVQELPNSKSINTPGWAYVQESGLNSAGAALQPGRKRAARNQPSASAHENTAKQDAKILRDLAALDKDSHKDVQIPVPVRHRDNAGRGNFAPKTPKMEVNTNNSFLVSHGKVTPAVRKILQSQKTFANHLSDAEALASLTLTQPQSQSQSHTATSSLVSASRASPASSSRSTPKPISQTGSGSKRSHKRKDFYSTATPAETPLRRVSTQNAAAAANNPTIKSELSTGADVVMGGTEAPSIAAGTSLLNDLPPELELKPHPGDNDPLLKSRIPQVPAEEELETLIAMPPLTYLEARGSLTSEDLKRPTRNFCEICGYWGRVKCQKCGTRVCALECLRTHQEDCYTRYGA